MAWPCLRVNARRVLQQMMMFEKGTRVGNDDCCYVSSLHACRMTADSITTFLSMISVDLSVGTSLTHVWKKFRQNNGAWVEKVKRAGDQR